MGMAAGENGSMKFNISGSWKEKGEKTNYNKKKIRTGINVSITFQSVLVLLETLRAQIQRREQEKMA